MNLPTIGWREFFSQQLHNYPGLTPGRVCRSQREHFLIWTEHGEVEATPGGRLRTSEGLWPVTGDWVMIGLDQKIEAVLTRQSSLERKQPGKTSRIQVLSANLDVLFVVAGLDSDFNPRRLERYLVLANEGGVKPVLVLNKADLHSDLTRLLSEARAVAGSSPVIAVSAAKGWGLDELVQLVAPAETAALAGSSGVGKSTLLNRLIGQDRQITQTVRIGDGRGQHTTTMRELFLMPQGWLMVDMPGIRELQLKGSGGESVEKAFDDIIEASGNCKFRDCRHESEPGCAVRETIEPARLDAYLKLQKESGQAKKHANEAAALLEKQKSKALHQKAIDKDSGRKGY